MTSTSVVNSRVPWRSSTVQVVLLATFLAPLGVPLVSPALPVIRDAFGVSDAAASLLVSGYFLTGIVLGAVFSGGIFGDHTSSISDTTVLASSTSGSDHMVHVQTQIPYALITAGIAATLFLLLGVVLPQGFRIIPY